MTRIMSIVDQNGRVVAAQLGAERAQDDDEEAPAGRLLPLPGQRMVEMDVPDEIGRLPGPDLFHFFSQVEVSWPASVNLPRIEVVRRPHDSTEG
jgi:hypothetical protein